MSKTWREAPKGPPKDPRPPEKGGQKNFYKQAIEEEFIDFDDDLLLEVGDEFNDDWIVSVEFENEEN